MDTATATTDTARPHRGWVRLLIFLTALFTVVAIFSAWVDRQVFDSADWTETSVELLRNPKIQNRIAEYAVDELYARVDVSRELENGLDKVGIDAPPMVTSMAASYGRQMVQELAVKALQSSQLQTLWQKANETAHRSLIDVLENRGTVLETSDGHVRLELRPLILDIASRIGLREQAEEKLPASVGSVSILDSEELATAQRVTRMVHGLALVSALLALLTLSGAIWLSPGYRWLTLIWLGVALVVAGLIVLVVRPIAGQVMVDRLADADVRPAAIAAWDISTHLLRSFAWTVIWSSLVLFALSWLTSPVRSAERSREFLAYSSDRYPVPYLVLFALVAFVFLITGAGNMYGFLVRLAIVIMAAGGLFAFRRNLAHEYPDADVAGLREFGDRTADSARQFGAKTADSARRLWSGSSRRVGRVFGSRGETEAEGAPDTAPLPEAAAAAPEKPADTDAGAPAPSSAEAETAVMVRDDAERFDLLERIGRLRDSGVLTEDEFTAEKQRILGGERGD